MVDLGCGPGSDLGRLVEAGHASIGVDRSAGLLGLAPRGARIRAPLGELLVAEGSLDAVWSQAALLHVETTDLAATFAEWERALRPAGSLASPRRSVATRAGSSWLQVLAITPHVRPPLTSVAERSVDRVLGLIGDRAGSRSGEPCLVAIDGRSAAGKSTFATAIAARLPTASVVRGDDFYRVIDDDVRFSLPPAEGFARDFDWERLRSEALDPLRYNRRAEFARLDWTTGQLGRRLSVEPASVAIVEGVYLLRPELRNLFDVTVFVDTAADMAAGSVSDRRR